MVPLTNTCVTVARPQDWSATGALPRQPCADVARAQWQGTTVVPRKYPCAVGARPSGHNGAVAPPKQSSANVAPLRWQHTVVVQPTCTLAAVARSSGQSAIMALPRQPYAFVVPVHEVRLDRMRRTAPPCRSTFLALHTAHLCACSWSFCVVKKVKLGGIYKRLGCALAFWPTFSLTTALVLAQDKGSIGGQPPCLVPPVLRQMPVLKPVCTPCLRTAPCLANCL